MFNLFMHRVDMHARWDVNGNSEHAPCPPRPGGGCSLVSQTNPSHEKFVRGAGSRD